MIRSEVCLVPIAEVLFDEEARQRTIKKSSVVELAESIQTRGLIHTILVDERTGRLIAGAHRLQAFGYLFRNEVECPYEEYHNWRLIPARYAYDVTDAEVEAIELEENIKRVNMSWDEEAKAIRRFHNLHCSLDENWTLTETGEELGISSGQISRYLQAAVEIERGNEKVIQAGSLSSAYNIIQRANERAIDAEMGTLLETEATLAEPQTIVMDEADFIDMESSAPASSKPPAKLPASASILHCNFHEWLEEYKGPKFNLLHCDFPYGIQHQKSDQGNVAAWGAYEDSPEIYWQLCTALAKNIDKILYKSAHVVFWFSMNFYSETVDFFTRNTDLEVSPFPLIWYKSDNKGLLPDPNRGPRRVYETALIMSRGDRKVVQAVANCYAGPTTKTIHVSEKSEAMLRHFFRMLVDEHTELLDPTCGSASALRAAESLGAKRVIGLEAIEENVENARMELDKFRTLQAMK